MPRSSNKLLASLSTDDFDLLEPHLESVTLGYESLSKDPTGELRPLISPKWDSHPLSPFNPTARRSRWD